MEAHNYSIHAGFKTGLADHRYDVYEDSSTDQMASPQIREKLMFDNSPRMFSDIKDTSNDIASKLSPSDRSNQNDDNSIHRLFYSKLIILSFSRLR